MSNLKKFNGTITNENTQQYLQKVLGEKKASFVNNITALVSSNTNLQECEPTSILFAGIKATALDLPLDANLGFAYVLPYKNHKTGISQAQFQLGYKGFKQLAIRTGQFKTIHATDVKEGEIIEHNRLTGEIAFNFIENDAEREKRKTVGYVSYFELLNGFTSTYYMTLANIEKHGKRYSQTYKKGFGMWKDDFDSMALKTVTKLNLSKNAPLSVEIQTAIKSDQAVITEDGETYVDNIENTPVLDAENPLDENNETNDNKLKFDKDEKTK